MAITWQNVSSPTFGGVAQMQQVGSEALNRGLTQLGAQAQGLADKADPTSAVSLAAAGRQDQAAARDMEKERQQLFRTALGAVGQTGDINAANQVLLNSGLNPEAIQKTSAQVNDMFAKATQVGTKDKQLLASQEKEFGKAIAGQESKAAQIMQDYSRSTEKANLDAFEKQAENYTGLNTSNINEALQNEQWWGPFANMSGKDLQAGLINAQEKFKGIPLGVFAAGLKQATERDTGYFFEDKEVNKDELNSILANVAKQYNTAKQFRAETEQKAKPYQDTIKKLQSSKQEIDASVTQAALQRGMERLAKLGSNR